MRTRAKLIVGALGFVAATTGLVLWQSTPPRLESVGTKLPITSVCGWLSPQEVVCEGGIFDLRTRQFRPLPFPLRSLNISHNFPDSMARDPITVYDNLTPSPDGKWLLYRETVNHKEREYDQNFVVVHPDGSGLRRITNSHHEWQSSSPFWLADSSGWINYYYTYGTLASGSSLYSREKNYPESRRAKGPCPTSIQNDGRFLYVNERNEEFVLCANDDMRTCTTVSVGQVLPSSGAITRFTVSRDSKWILASRDIQASQIPERATWEVLLKRKLPVTYDEFWLLSTDGKTKRCLARETITEETHKYSQGFSASFSPDGKQALVFQPGKSGSYLVSL